MAARKKIVIEDISFEPGGPTAVTTEQLRAWVIWQFPRLRAGGYGGAVHPPGPEPGWLPAIVDASNGQVLVFAHIKERFSTPEAAAKHLDQMN